MDLDPRIDDFLKANMEERGYRVVRENQLLALGLLAARGDAPAFPLDVIRGWRRLVTTHRRQVDQSEEKLLEVVQRQELSEAEIVEHLGVESAAAVERRRLEVVEQLAANHPTTAPGKWT
ncbi:hypothetical protein ACIRG5_12255 [Lentzea sp. NPDC102401]|uniref:hypothetical protein n=1 Tax=Lentzea sp. NPDC102401 TaxID=3364128 RepID=UPI00380B69BF